MERRTATHHMAKIFCFELTMWKSCVHSSTEGVSMYLDSVRPCRNPALTIHPLTWLTVLIQISFQLEWTAQILSTWVCRLTEWLLLRLNVFNKILIPVWVGCFSAECLPPEFCKFRVTISFNVDKSYFCSIYYVEVTSRLIKLLKLFNSFLSVFQSAHLRARFLFIACFF